MVKDGIYFLSEVIAFAGCGPVCMVGGSVPLTQVDLCAGQVCMESVTFKVSCLPVETQCPGYVSLPHLPHWYARPQCSGYINLDCPDRVYHSLPHCFARAWCSGDISLKCSISAWLVC